MVGTILGTAAQIGGSIYGAVKSSEANEKAMDLIAKQRDDNKKWYEAKMAEDYTQRADVQNVLRKQRELLTEQYQRAKAANVVAGGTDEALAMQQQAANASMGETYANIAAQASSAKEEAESAYRTADSALIGKQATAYQNQADAIAKAAGQVGEAASGLVGGISDAVSGAVAKSSADATGATGQTDVTKAEKVATQTK